MRNDTYWGPNWGMDWGLNYGWIWSIILTVLIIAGIVLLIVFLARRYRNDNRAQQIGQNQQAFVGHARIMEILKVRFEGKLLSFDEYEERRTILESGWDDDYMNHELVLLKERYARNEVDSREYCKERNRIAGDY